MKKDKLNETTKEITSILDREYFHTCVEQKENGQVSWQVFYKNLPTKVYYSKKNKPLLTSTKNGIADIYKLRDNFETEKSNEYLKHVTEMVNIRSTTNRGLWKLHDLYTKYVAAIICLITTGTLINILYLHSFALSAFILYFVIGASFASVTVTKRIEEEISKANDKIVEVFIKDKIKNMGLYFVEKIKI